MKEVEESFRDAGVYVRPEVRILVHAIIRFDEQICHSKNREEAARFATF